MNEHRDVNRKICEIFGLDPKVVRAITIEIKPDAFPRITIRSLNKEAGDVRFENTKYRIESVERE